MFDFVGRYNTWTDVVYSYEYACRTQRQHNEDERHSSLEKYTFHFIWKGCVWEGVGGRTQLQHIDPHSICHNRVSFPFSWAAQPGAWEPGGPASLGHVPQSSIFAATAQSGSWGPTLLSAGFLYHILSPTHLISSWLNFLCTELYNSSTLTFFLWASQFRTHSTCPRSRL